ncbi:hypothetical protein T492DRAFT_847878 [Pavlovales sp. CCMP2436]|nr:hypothetical protein T492DRAFT_847878 [Pavlovales sp. CCMP2436]
MPDRSRGKSASNGLATHACVASGARPQAPPVSDWCAADHSGNSGLGAARARASYVCELLQWSHNPQLPLMLGRDLNTGRFYQMGWGGATLRRLLPAHRDADELRCCQPGAYGTAYGYWCGWAGCWEGGGDNATRPGRASGALWSASVAAGRDLPPHASLDTKLLATTRPLPGLHRGGALTNTQRST